MLRTVCRGCGVLAVVWAAAGCGGEPGPVPVRGVVKLDGQPVANAAVVFVAQAPGGRDAYGSTDAAGAFKLTTAKPTAAKGPRIPVKYTVAGQTPLTQEVPAKGDVAIELSSK